GSGVGKKSTAVNVRTSKDRGGVQFDVTAGPRLRSFWLQLLLCWIYRPVRATYHLRQVGAQDRRTQIPLDMLNDDLGAARVTDVRRLAGVVQGISQITGQHHVLAQPAHLPETEGPVHDAIIGVYAHQNDVLDSLLLAEVEDFLSAVADAVEADD